METIIHGGIKKVQTPYGAIPETLYHEIKDKLGIKWDDGHWVILSFNTGQSDKNGKDLWLPTRFMNLEVALQQAKQRNLTEEESRFVSNKDLRSNPPTEADWILALSFGYGKDYLPDILGEKSYSAIYRRFGLD